ncbi:hypothetical protein BDY19DRAFT_999125 [Irpex rosettiformis]|uniref:Uncharacterized protein n=1 Tax=Irpex rosettiformis TaxID=378272 RepID=A0ACB8TLP6_9APHY|nr:hypothetical protein BDY19DRAFT_999125 [Irpex rosettiformis]
MVRNPANPDHFFDNVGLSVNVFHFNCKHSITDTYCRQHCDPRSFPELQNDDGSWYFNSSAAEQVNSWIGKYQSICREMVHEKFEFFLDEMIMRRNKVTLTKLKRDGHMPNYWTKEQLDEASELRIHLSTVEDKMETDEARIRWGVGRVLTSLRTPFSWLSTYTAQGGDWQVHDALKFIQDGTIGSRQYE